MEKIASFQVDHTKITPGMYLSRQDGDVATYDIRFVKPNTPPYLDMPAVHTIEHLAATYVRNSAYGEHILYFGPMGCRTGFYFLTRSLGAEQAIGLMRETLAFIASYAGEIPGVSAAECGNYREHDLSGARRYAAEMRRVLDGWTADKLTYPY